MTDTTTGDGEGRVSSKKFFTLLCCCSRNGGDVADDIASLIDDLPDQPSSVENKRQLEFSSSVCHSNNLKKYLIDNYTDQRLYEEHPEYLNPFAQGYETNYDGHRNNSDFEQSTSFSTCSRLSTPYDDYH